MLKSSGRMIRRDISRSKTFASLTSHSKILFCMMIPHFDSHGKMNGEPNYIKGECVPLLKEFTVSKVAKCLAEIGAKTNVKWFLHNNLHYLHSVNWLEHQEIRKDRLGNNQLPEYSRSSPGVLPHEVEVKDEVKVEVKDEYMSDFEKVWNAYPKKAGKPEAKAAFQKTVKSPEDVLLINRALENYLKTERFKKGYIRDGSTWFRSWHQWIDYKDPEVKNHGAGEAAPVEGKYDHLKT